MVAWTQMTAWLLGAFFLSSGLTYWLYRIAHRRGWLAIPNDRSSHTIPTPSGAGLAIAVTFLSSAVAFAMWGTIDLPLMLALVGGGTAIAIVGWIDERRPLRMAVRLPVHLASAVMAVALIGGIWSTTLGVVLGAAVAVIGIVWMSNLYNFMDGIDGLIGMQAVYVCAVMGVWLWGAAPSLALLLWVLGAGSAGFLVWNWHPARIFMGDIGSVLIGFCFAVIAVWTHERGLASLWLWAILLMPFIVDANATTLRRLLHKKRWYEAHREFAYQQVSKRRYTHAQVVWGVLVLNLVTLPLGVLALYDPSWTWAALVTSATVWTMVWWRAQQMIKSSA